MIGLIEMMLLKAMSASAAHEEANKRKRQKKADAVTVRKKATAVPAAPAEIPAELAGMAWELLINKQYDGGFSGKF